MLGLAASQAGEQQQQQLNSDLQGLLACSSAVTAAIGSASAPAAPETDSAALAAAAALHSSSSTTISDCVGRQACSKHAGSSDSRSSSSCAAAPSTAMTPLLVALGQRLVSCGGALVALCPVPLCCNNPGCVELRGASELQLVGGKGTVCSLCRCVVAVHCGVHDCVTRKVLMLYTCVC
jgi:hypothetical protein